MKLILPATLNNQLAPHLPKDIEVIWASREAIDGDISNAEVYCNDPVFSQAVHHQVLQSATALRWYHASSAGVNHIVADLRSRNVRVTNSAGIFADPIAETVMGYILAQAKTFFQLRSQQAQRDWAWDTDADTRMSELAGRVLLIVGAGGIGQAIARRAAAFGLRVWGVRRRPEPMAHFERVVSSEGWQALLPEAHYLVLAAPLTPETKGLLNAAAFGKMRPDAYLINVGRGALIDEQALLSALSQQRIVGAAIDTFVEEPLPQDSPFWDLDNLFITPHVSGLSPRNAERIAALFLDNLERYRQGEALRNLVDLTSGY
ncbi:MAG: D-2-hydroxyacid dehydrogenase [Elainellaceae cyanobacterium]